MVKYMKISCRRIEYGDTYTVSRIYVNGSFECFGLEDKVRPDGVKIYGQTAIPAGTYKIVIDYSEHFGKKLIHLLDVPNFKGIRIHAGNTAEDTNGCILVGKDWPGNDTIFNSRAAYESLATKVEEALKVKAVFIEVIDTKENSPT